MLSSTCPWGQNPMGAGESKLLIPFLLPSLVSWFDLSLPAEPAKKLITYPLDMPSWIRNVGWSWNCFMPCLGTALRTRGALVVQHLYVARWELLEAIVSFILWYLLGFFQLWVVLWVVSPTAMPFLLSRTAIWKSGEQNIIFFNGFEAFLLPSWPRRERTPDIYLLFQSYVGRLQTIKWDLMLFMAASMVLFSHEKEITL